jgi:hypothetical protein
MTPADIDIASARAICEAATPGPWHAVAEADAGDGRSVAYADRVPHLHAIRVSRPTVATQAGTRSLSALQRDADAAAHRAEAPP